MATHHGKEGVVKIGANTVAEIVDFSVNEQAEIADDTAMGDAANTHLVGHVSWTAECKCHWDETDTSGQGAMTIGASVVLHLHPEGATSGDVDMTGTATVTGKSQSVPLRGVVEQSFTLTGNGALTIGAVA